MNVRSLLKIGTASCVASLCIPSLASPLSVDSLIEACKAHSRAPESIPAARCAVYIQGFLDGTRAALARNADSKRTLSTPFGSRVSRDPSAVRAEYCLETDTSVSEIIRNILHHVRESSNSDAPAHELLDEVLRLHYPCGPKRSAREPE
jgi:hypothetical protein